MKPKKPKGIRSKGTEKDSLSISFVKDPVVLLCIGGWDSEVTLTSKELVKLYKWLHNALPYIKAQRNKI